MAPSPPPTKPTIEEGLSDSLGSPQPMCDEFGSGFFFFCPFQNQLCLQVDNLESGGDKNIQHWGKKNIGAYWPVPQPFFAVNHGYLTLLSPPLFPKHMAAVAT